MPIINGEHRYHVAIAADENASAFGRALAYWQDLIEIRAEGHSSLPAECVEAMTQVWCNLARDLENGDSSIDELRGFAQAFGAAAGFNVKQSCWAQDAFEFVEESCQ